jgi:hypothetical protein
VHLTWRKKGAGWTARSADGSKARIYPHPAGRADTWFVEVDVGGKTLAKGLDGSAVIGRSTTPARTRRQILDDIRREAEGYVMRYETTGILDAQEANDTIVRMDGLEWHRRLSAWRSKNPARDGKVQPPQAPAATTTVTETRAVALRFHLDTNRINARRGLPSMNRLEAWHRNRVIELLMPEPAADEAMRGHNAARRRKAQTYVHGMTLAQTPDEVRRLKTIEGIVFPMGAASESERRDVEIVFNAQKYGGHLVTADGASKRQPGGILGARVKLAGIGISVLTDEEACTLVDERIRARDERARYEAATTGAPLPDWVGQD